MTCLLFIVHHQRLLPLRSTWPLSLSLSLSLYIYIYIYIYISETYRRYCKYSNYWHILKFIFGYLISVWSQRRGYFSVTNVLLPHDIWHKILRPLFIVVFIYSLISGPLEKSFISTSMRWASTLLIMSMVCTLSESFFFVPVFYSYLYRVQSVSFYWSLQNSVNSY